MIVDCGCFVDEPFVSILDLRDLICPKSFYWRSHFAGGQLIGREIYPFLCVQALLAVLFGGIALFICPLYRVQYNAWI